MELDPAIRAYYEKGDEAERIASEAGRLELERTQELIRRFLPQGSLNILDVGGGPGTYASWLAEMGHRVHVVDPIPLHVEQASASGISAEVGDARNLGERSDSYDAVLLLGPLYHLPVRSDRESALGEAMRVLRPGGVLFAAAISRHAALLDLLINWDKLHLPSELADEISHVGFNEVGVTSKARVS